MTEPARRLPGGTTARRPDVLEVVQPRLVRALARGPTRRYLAPFFAGPKTASEAAALAGMELKSFSNKVEALVRGGLLEEVRRERRSGRALRYFQTAAHSFFIPIDAFPIELFVAGEGAYQRRFVDALVTVAARLGDQHPAPVGFRVHPAAEAGQEAEFNLAARPGLNFDPRSPSIPAFVTSWMTLELDDADARALQQELLGLLQKYRARSRVGANRYLTRWGLVPLEHETPVSDG